MADDAVLRDLAVICEAVRAVPCEFKAERPHALDIVAGRRNLVVDEYLRVNARPSFETSLTTSSPALAATVRGSEGSE